MSKRYRAAIIGCGLIGSSLQDREGGSIRGISTHAAAYSAHDNIELIALCDSRQETLTVADKRWGPLSCHDSYTDLLNKEKPEMVSVATHVDSHYEITKACLISDSVKGVLLEKPVCHDIDEARELAAIAKKYNKALNVNYSRRFSPVFQKIASKISKGVWGDPLIVTGTYTKGLFHNGTHWIDMYRMLFAEPEEAFATSSPSFADEVDPMTSFTLKHKSKMSAEVKTFAHEHHTIFDMDIILTGGRIRIIDQSDTIEVYTVKEDWPFAGYHSLDKQNTYQQCLSNALMHAVDDLVMSIESHHSVSPIESAIKNLEWAADIKKSLLTS